MIVLAFLLVSSLLILSLYEYIRYGLNDCGEQKELFILSILNILGFIFIDILIIFSKNFEYYFWYFVISLHLLIGINIYSLYNFIDSKFYNFNNADCKYEYVLITYINTLLSNIISITFLTYLIMSIVSIIFIIIGKIGEFIYNINLIILNKILNKNLISNENSNQNKSSRIPFENQSDSNSDSNSDSEMVSATFYIDDNSY
jgi:hypothetical protein